MFLSRITSRSSSSKIWGNIKIERLVGGLHTTTGTMAKFDLAHKYNGLEKNVW